ncbi:MAG: hypothetical protein VKJ02_09145 [Snowella sp.]|nr:hypothetical protein [Snowella sp.]
MPQKWKFYNRATNKEWIDTLIADYELDYDAITDDYTPEDITAHELFSMWVDQIEKKYPNQLIPISWGLWLAQSYENIPFQYPHTGYETEKNFLKHFTWPIDDTTGKKLNWLSLPIADKKWNSERADKGGFIQEITNWKPSILQPFVYLPTLLNSIILK